MIGKKQSSVVIVKLAIVAIGFLLVPLFFNVHFLKAYYVFCSGVLFVGTAIDLVCLNRTRSFSQRWEKTRTKPYVLNVMREGLPFTISNVTSIFAGAVFARGYTPAEFLEIISPSQLVLIFLFLIVACLGSGALSYRRKETFFLANHRED